VTLLEQVENVRRQSEDRLKTPQQIVRAVREELKRTNHGNVVASDGYILLDDEALFEPALHQGRELESVSLDTARWGWLL